MQLIGMLDSPYVRRVAVAMLSAGVAFEHKPISLFRHIDAFSALSPMLKAPSLIVDDGVALVESGVILDYLGSRFPAVAALRPQGLAAFRALGGALTVMEKAVQIHYERALRGPARAQRKLAGADHAATRRRACRAGTLGRPQAGYEAQARPCRNRRRLRLGIRASHARRRRCGGRLSAPRRASPRGPRRCRRFARRRRSTASQAEAMR